MDHSRRALIVDDQELNLVILHAYLALIGFETIVARDGVEALAKLDEQIDVVFLDISMPRMDGLEALKRIRNELGSTVPVTMVSAFDSGLEKKMAFELGATGYFTKPIDFTEIAAHCAQLFGT